MAELIKKVQIPGSTVIYDICDQYARDRLEGLSTVYSISCEYTKGASDTYVDWDTGADVTTLTAKNSSFKSTIDEITISKGAGENDAYLVLTATVSANKYYVKKMANMQLGDTVYVIEAATVASDRWLSAFTESPLSGTFKALNEKIDLSGYAKKGTYPSSTPSTNVTGSAGAETAAVTISGIKYDKADSATGSAGNQTVNTSNAGAQSITSGDGGAVSISYQPAGTLSGSQSISAHSHSVNLATDSATLDVAASIQSAGAHTHSVSVSGDITLGDLVVAPGEGTATYTPAGTISKPNVTVTGSTVNVNTDAIKGVTSTFTGTATTISISGNVTGTAVSGQTITLSSDVPDEINFKISAPAEDHSVTNSTASFTGVTSISGFSGGSITGATPITVVTGVTGGAASGTVTVNKGYTYTDTAFNTQNVVTGYASFSGGALNPATAKTVVTGVTAASASGTTAVVTGYPNFNGGSLNAATATTVVTGVTAAALTGDTSFFKGATVSDGLLSFNVGTVGVSGGSASGTTSVVPSYTLTKAALGAASTASVVTGVTGGVASGTASVVPSYTLTPASLGAASTVSVLGSVKTAGTITSTGTSTVVTGVTAASASTASVVPSYTHTPASLGTQNKGTITYVTNVSVADHTFNDYSPNGTISIPAAKQTFTVTQGSFSGSTNYTPAGTIGNTYTAAGTTTVLKGVNAALAAAPTFTGTGVRLQAAAGTVTGSMSGTAAEAGSHDHLINHDTSSITFVTGVTLNTAGAATVDFSKATFTGTSVTLSQAAHNHSVSVASHTHSVTVSSHTHSIGLTSTAVTGSASAAISNHTHTLSNHTHNVTI